LESLTRPRRHLAGRPCRRRLGAPAGSQPQAASLTGARYARHAPANLPAGRSDDDRIALPGDERHRPRGARRCPAALPRACGATGDGPARAAERAPGRMVGRRTCARAGQPARDACRRGPGGCADALAASRRRWRSPPASPDRWSNRAFGHADPERHRDVGGARRDSAGRRAPTSRAAAR
jgi:hypothetical protein